MNRSYVHTCVESVGVVWEQNPLVPLGGMPRENGEQKTEDFTVYQNRVDLMGFLGADAQSRTTRDGVPFTVLSLATKRSWKDSQGEWQSHTDWHRVIPRLRDQVAEFAAGEFGLGGDEFAAEGLCQNRRHEGVEFADGF